VSDGISDNIGYCACGPSDSDIFPVSKELAEAYKKGQITEEVGMTIGNPNCVAGVSINTEPSIREKLAKTGLYSAADIEILVEQMGVVDVKQEDHTVTLKIKPKHRAETIVISSTLIDGPPKPT